MTLHLKAGVYQDARPEQRMLTRTLLRPIDGRSGYAFALLSLEKRRAEPGPLFDIIQEHIDRLASSFGKDANPQHRFEQFLRALNEQLATGVREGQWDVPIASLHAMVGIACDTQMFLSGTGDLTSLFLHRRANQQYQIYNLFRSIQTEQSLPTWEKPFAVVLDGDLHEGDVFCVANRDLQRFLPADDLNEILTTLPPPGATAKIRQYFPHGTDLALLIVQSRDADPVQVTTEAQPLGELSVDNLTRMEEETQRLLDDQKPRLSTLTKTALPKIREVAVAIGGAIWNTSRVLGEKVVGVARQAKSQRPSAESVKATAQRFRERFKTLPTTSKTLGLAAVVVLILLVVSITALSGSKTQQADEAGYQSQIALIRDRQERAEAAVIIKNEEQARILYGEALELVRSLPRDSETREQTASQMERDVQTALDTLRNIVNIPEPAIAATLIASPDIIGTALLSTSSGMYVFGSDKSVYKVDSAAKTAARIETAQSEVGAAREVAAEDGEILFLDDRPGISRFDSDNASLQIVDVALASGTRWTDLVLYANKLYVLQPSDGQVIKYGRAGGAFDGGTQWIKATSTDLGDAISLAIDATIFILKQNGDIVRFTSGSEIGWDPGTVDPPMTSASDIWTDGFSDYVYVLEPASQRLVVYRKEDGAFLVQYRSDAWSGLTDFVVDETNKNIYLLAGQNVYTIQASHIQ